MAEPTLTVGQRAQVVAYANQHGPTRAARRYQVPLGSVKAWQVRARRREALRAAWKEAARATPGTPPVAEPDTSEDVIRERMAAGLCLRCGGVGRVPIPATRHGTLTVRRAHHRRCPDCGGAVRIIQVVEHPRDSWTEAQRVAGDLGLGWNGREWAMIQAGEPHPDGLRWTGHDTPGGGQ